VELVLEREAGEKTSPPLPINRSPQWLVETIARGDATGFVEVRSFSGGKPAQRFFDVGELDAAHVCGYVEERTEDADVFFGVAVRAGRKGTAEESLRTSLLYSDLDHGLAKAKAFPLKPTFVQRTSKGRFQALWVLVEPVDLTDETERAEYEHVLRGLVAATGGDENARDIARVLRFPGSVNWKRAEPVISTPVLFEPGREYNLSDFALYLPELEPLDEQRTTRPATPASEWREIVTGGVSELTRDTTITRLAGHLLRRYVDPYVTLELLQVWNRARCRPPLPDADIAKCVNSIARKELRRRHA
jgi:hypothetical protein